MATLTAFLRAINVGGTGKLAMADLRHLCQELGFENVTTYIQSGNVVFSTKLSKAKAQQSLAEALEDKLGKPGTCMCARLMNSKTSSAATHSRRRCPSWYKSSCSTAPSKRELGATVGRTPRRSRYTGARYSCTSQTAWAVQS